MLDEMDAASCTLARAILEDNIWLVESRRYRKAAGRERYIVSTINTLKVKSTTSRDQDLMGIAGD